MSGQSFTNKSSTKSTKSFTKLKLSHVILFCDFTEVQRVSSGRSAASHRWGGCSPTSCASTTLLKLKTCSRIRNAGTILSKRRKSAIVELLTTAKGNFSNFSKEKNRLAWETKLMYLFYYLIFSIRVTNSI